MTERKIKSYGLFGTMQFIDSTYSADVRSTILSNIPQDVLDFVNNSSRPPWAPPEYSCYFWQQIAKVAATEQDAFDKLVACGQCMGEYATNTYLRLLLKVVNMKIMAGKIPALWSKDANFGKVRADLAEVGDGRVVFHYDEIEGYPFFGPICKGWLSFSMSAMGMTNSDVSLVDWSMANPDPGALTLQMSWTP